MKSATFPFPLRSKDYRLGVRAACLGLLALQGCSPERPPPARAAEAPREVVVEAPRHIEASAPYRARLPHGAELFLPTWFSTRRGTYDLLVHFHGLTKLQETNVDHARLDVAVVTVNLGVGTDGYASAFRDPQSFGRLLDEAQAEIDKSGRAPGAKVRRIALSAWSAGFVSVAKIMSDPASAERVDAVLLADGFFTSFTDVKRRVINTASLERFVALAESAARNHKLFAISHTTIPTPDYPSVEETVAKLLEMTSTPKTASTQVGPREMKATYTVDRGAFHVKGYLGVTAGDHIKQIHAMGETLYPYLKTRWEAAEPPATRAEAPPAPL